MERIKDLLARRASLVEEARGMLKKLDEEKRAEFNAEERQKYDTLIGEQDKIKVRVDDEERISRLERELEKPITESDIVTKSPEKGETVTQQVRTFRKYITDGFGSLSSDERRDLVAGSQTLGGSFVPPEQFNNQLLKAIDDQVFIRNLATKYTLTQGASLGTPTLDANPSDAAWTTELATGSADTAMVTGKRVMVPNPVAKRIKLSNTLLRLSSLPVESIIMDRFAYVFGITQEKAFLTGDGTSKPLGLFTASAQGIPTTRDVSTGNTTTAITFDGLINSKFSLKAQYQATGQWLFHRDGVKQLVLIKDGNGQYIWQQSMIAGRPDSLMGNPLNMSEYVPNTFTTGLYVGMFADFSNYWIVDALNLSMKRLDELYAETDQVGFIARLETDGAPVLTEAFSRVKLA